jgi:hypothetical protein
MIAQRRAEAPTFGSVLTSLRHAWQNPRKKRRLRHRILEAIREIGILLMAFAPLDGALMPMPETQRQTMLIFFFGGILLFVLGVLLEMGIDDGR